mgnify:CR=1 FL=1
MFPFSGVAFDLGLGFGDEAGEFGDAFGVAGRRGFRHLGRKAGEPVFGFGDKLFKPGDALLHLAKLVLAETGFRAFGRG